MARMVGTIVRGLRSPIVRQGDSIEQIVVDTVLKAAEAEGFEPRDRDIVAVTESVVARAQGNYATCDQIARDVRDKFGGGTLGVLFPILSRNRFAVLLRGIARAADRLVLQLSYPSDEVGNRLFDPDLLDEAGINPWSDVLTEAEYRRRFGEPKHPFTGVDYVAYYRSIVEEAGASCDILFSNRPETILAHTRRVLACDIHSRHRTKKKLLAAGAERVLGLSDLLTRSVDGSGYNETYGLLGSNKATEDSVKLFPRDCQPIVDRIQRMLKEKTGRHIEVMIYGDGAFKDPAGNIWELADPVVSPAYTAGLDGTPNEVKLKYVADNQFAGLRGEELEKAVTDYIRSKKPNLTGSMEAQGTTPRRLTDLIGSLCDLTSGSGDKGTPIVYIQGYFDHYAM